ncbi:MULTISPECIES: cupin domain-containing protein [unclassified Nostoc]|uniref:cupin domain-containing protein n=1 Tax=unclassified Nostoc TaxID=2593658 RepID=UPI0025AAE40B|nr:MULTISPECIES: cupin domain-containing protein [unclassified Nostoc]MDM9584032.1 cupin domain-containing protein [Nostoc sp. GT001]MDZ7943664.1 cupin domain-containing protein [Nostoc sp. EfeVER01]MDZ7991671.1 cupin domain-containing protein [Nostoc sp. EspVER01]
MFNLKKFLIVILIVAFSFVSFNISLKAAQGTERIRNYYSPEPQNFVTVTPDQPTPTYTLANTSTFKFLIQGEDTGGQYSVNLVTLSRQGDGLPLAVHHNDSDVLVVLDGELRLDLDGKSVSAPSGTFAYLPPKLPHAIRNSGTQPAKFLLYNFPEKPSRSLATPLERFIKAAGMPVANLYTPSFPFYNWAFPNWAFPNWARKMYVIGMQNGIEFIAPFNKQYKPDRKYIIVPPDAHDRPVYDALGGRYTLLATGEETGGNFGFVSFENPPGAATPPHKHPFEDEGYFHVSGGAFTVQMKQETMTVTPGSWAFLPRKHTHGFITSGETPAYLVTVITPAKFLEFFKDVGVEVKDRSAPIAPPIDLQKIITIATQKYGLEFVPPIPIPSP